MLGISLLPARPCARCGQRHTGSQRWKGGQGIAEDRRGFFFFFFPVPDETVGLEQNSSRHLVPQAASSSQMRSCCHLAWSLLGGRGESRTSLGQAHARTDKAAPRSLLAKDPWVLPKACQQKGDLEPLRAGLQRSLSQAEVKGQAQNLLGSPSLPFSSTARCSFACNLHLISICNQEP